jgi:hypothetical protein
MGTWFSLAQKETPAILASRAFEQCGVDASLQNLEQLDFKY